MCGDEPAGGDDAISPRRLPSTRAEAPSAMVKRFKVLSPRDASQKVGYRCPAIVRLTAQVSVGRTPSMSQANTTNSARERLARSAVTSIWAIDGVAMTCSTFTATIGVVPLSVSPLATKRGEEGYGGGAP